MTITVPAGMTRPATVGRGTGVERTVKVGAGNMFTLVAIEVEDRNRGGGARGGSQGVVRSSTTTQIVVNANGTRCHLVAPAGTTLPVLRPAPSVEARGVQRKRHDHD